MKEIGYYVRHARPTEISRALARRGSQLDQVSLFGGFVETVKKWIIQAHTGEIFDIGYGWHPSRKPMLFNTADEAWAFAVETFEKSRDKLETTMQVIPVGGS